METTGTTTIPPPTTRDTTVKLDWTTPPKPIMTEMHLSEAQITNLQSMTTGIPYSNTTKKDNTSKNKIITYTLASTTATVFVSMLLILIFKKMYTIRKQKLQRIKRYKQLFEMNEVYKETTISNL